MSKLITIMCAKPGMMKFGRAWGTATLVEVVEKGREPSKGSPAEAAISCDDLAKLEKLIEAHRIGRFTCPFAITDPNAADVQKGLASAELAELERKHEQVKRLLIDADERLSDALEKNEDADRKLAAAERKAAEAEARAQAANEATERAEAKLRQAQERLAELEQKPAQKPAQGQGPKR